jgi:hypothetical protein
MTRDLADRAMRRAGHVTSMEEERNAYRILLEKSEKETSRKI